MRQNSVCEPQTYISTHAHRILIITLIGKISPEEEFVAHPSSFSLIIIKSAVKIQNIHWYSRGEHFKLIKKKHLSRARLQKNPIRDKIQFKKKKQKRKRKKEESRREKLIDDNLKNLRIISPYSRGVSSPGSLSSESLGACTCVYVDAGCKLRGMLSYTHCDIVADIADTGIPCCRQRIVGDVAAAAAAAATAAAAAVAADAGDASRRYEGGMAAMGRARADPTRRHWTPRLYNDPAYPSRDADDSRDRSFFHSSSSSVFLPSLSLSLAFSVFSLVSLIQVYFPSSSSLWFSTLEDSLIP